MSDPPDVVWRAEDCVCAARLGGEHLGDAEVAHLDHLLLRQEDVRRLQVAVQHVLAVATFT